MKGHRHEPRGRVARLILVLLCGVWPSVSSFGQKLVFDRGTLSIPTTLYGGFLIDRDGFMWIGTTGLGAYRYDGREMKSFSGSVRGSMISSIVEDREGGIWFASFSEGITHYDKDSGEYTVYRHDPQDSTSARGRVDRISLNVNIKIHRSSVSAVGMGNMWGLKRESP